jgi:hypothetical protein
MAQPHERSGTVQRAALRAASRIALTALVATGSAFGSASNAVAVRFAPDAVVAQVADRGGFTGLVGLAHQIASVTVLGDGSVITPAPVPAMYPGPAITPLRAGHISQSQIRTLLVDAGRLGLLARPLDFGSPRVSDLGQTTVSIDDGTRTVVQSAYALAFDTEDADLTSPQRHARHALETFIKELNALPTGQQSFTPRAVAVFTIDHNAFPKLPAATPRRWPIATLPAMTAPTHARCVIVKGAEVAPLLAALSDANEITPWQVGARTLELAFKPLLPGDACIL